MEMIYVAPELEVLEVMVEVGFNASLGIDDSKTPGGAFE